jgi:hypothetical protein
MDQTPNLALPYIAPAQAQKHVTHNEAIRALDAIVQIGVLDRDLATPPAAPADGDRYVVGHGATGAWAGRENSVAAWQDGAWMFYEPSEGWLAWVCDEAQLCAWNGEAWIVAASGSGESGGGSDGSFESMGINATADTTNRLALKSAASLFDHEGAGHQHKINKNIAADVASLLFQTDYAGRAELGTTGDDNFHVKVSADGSSWKDAIVVDKATGVATFPFTPQREVLTENRTYYVRSDGSDTNTGRANNAGGAFRTIQKAINTVAALDISIFNVDIRLSAETYTGIIIANVTAPWVGAGTVTIKGQPGTILQASNTCVQSSNVGTRIRVDTLDIRSSSIGLQAINGGMIEIGSGLIFGQCNANHMRSNGPGSKIIATGASYTINGNAGVHYNASPGGFIDGTSANVKLTGTPAFSVAFCFSDRLGLATFLAASFSGSATGPRYNVNSNAVINTSGGGANFFPGSTAGTDNSGAGKYL